MNTNVHSHSHFLSMSLYIIFSYIFPSSLQGLIGDIELFIIEQKESRYVQLHCTYNIHTYLVFQKFRKFHFVFVVHGLHVCMTMTAKLVTTHFKEQKASVL